MKNRIIKRLAQGGLALGLSIGGVALASQEANATVRTGTRSLGSCSVAWQVGTLGSGWSTKITATSNGCLYIEARRSGDQTWRRVTNPNSGSSVSLPQGNNIWVQFRFKSEIQVLVNGYWLDTVTFKSNISPGDWSNTATITHLGYTTTNT